MGPELGVMREEELFSTGAPDASMSGRCFDGRFWTSLLSLLAMRPTPESALLYNMSNAG